ncbi:pentapeptide repeat-containing protein [Kineococcus glutinatus]|uniref:pentapeptide repeat-containing protein n=1 Tax=Kineococcus glutinatus TaxID=1070872 RepID=UPI0031E611E9
MSGVVAGFVIFPATVWSDSRLAQRQEQVEEQRAEQQEVLENVRFVRERSGQRDAAKPFRGLNLTEASLAGLDLSCAEPTSVGSCADLLGANLTGADLRETNLTGANLRETNLADAKLSTAILADSNLADVNLAGLDLFGADLHQSNLSGADLSGANLSIANLNFAHLEEANLSGADLHLTDLRNANMAGADLTGALIEGACFNSNTSWPHGFKPPNDSNCAQWFPGRGPLSQQSSP